MFETFYNSFWQHPLLLWLFPVFFLARVRPGGNFFERAVLVFAVLTILDPLMTGPVTEFMGWGESTAGAVMLTFVLLGDFRFFFFIEHFSGGSRSGASPGSRAAYLSAAGLTCVVPLLQAALIKIAPEAFSNVRHTFLAYELLFLLLATFFRFSVLPRRAMSDEVRVWLSSVCHFAMAYYALWATADVMILAGADVGFALRVVPNVLYYGLFVPFVFYMAPPSLKTKEEAR